MPFYCHSSGRYIDRFERRDGKWAIAERICLVEARDDNWGPEGMEVNSAYVEAKRDAGDVSYMRPLKIDRSRVTG